MSGETEEIDWTERASILQNLDVEELQFEILELQKVKNEYRKYRESQKEKEKLLNSFLEVFQKVDNQISKWDEESGNIDSTSYGDIEIGDLEDLNISVSNETKSRVGEKNVVRKEQKMQNLVEKLRDELLFQKVTELVLQKSVFLMERKHIEYYNHDIPLDTFLLNHLIPILGQEFERRLCCGIRYLFNRHLDSLENENSSIFFYFFSLCLHLYNLSRRNSPTDFGFQFDIEIFEKNVENVRSKERKLFNDEYIPPDKPWYLENSSELIPVKRRKSGLAFFQRILKTIIYGYVVLVDVISRRIEVDYLDVVLKDMSKGQGSVGRKERFQKLISILERIHKWFCEYHIPSRIRKHFFRSCSQIVDTYVTNNFFLNKDEDSLDIMSVMQLKLEISQIENWFLKNIPDGVVAFSRTRQCCDFVTIQKKKNVVSDTSFRKKVCPDLNQDQILRLIGNIKKENNEVSETPKKAVNRFSLTRSTPRDEDDEKKVDLKFGRNVSVTSFEHESQEGRKSIVVGMCVFNFHLEEDLGIRSELYSEFEKDIRLSKLYIDSPIIMDILSFSAK